MASKDCTDSGKDLFQFLGTVIFLWYLLDMLLFLNILETVPDVGMKIGLAAVSVFFVGTAGTGMLYNGLANGRFTMQMRVTLVTLGSVLAFGSVAVGMIFGLTQI